MATRFLKLTNAKNDQPCFIRADKIIIIEQDNGYIKKDNYNTEHDYTLVVAGSEYGEYISLTVNETPEKIYSMLV
jgi:alpha-glucosidase (family GH31 glycosyl hydrolase)